MKKLLLLLILVVIFSCSVNIAEESRGVSHGISNTVEFSTGDAPAVTNVRAVQRADGSGKVDIFYSLSNLTGDPMTVKLVASNDDGKTWGIHCNTVSQDVGMGVNPGAEKHIIWDAAADYPNISRASLKFKVIAHEGNIQPILEEFVYVSGGRLWVPSLIQIMDWVAITPFTRFPGMPS
ncbi:MAG TPA: hypothetical protein PL126_00835 [Candidatus Cloacimonadota bacterium]|nr:hypothetical protein [Candidatus Cloacimonadota bacterium]